MVKYVELGGEKAPGFSPDRNPCPLYLELIGVGQLGLELTVALLAGPQVSLEALQPFLQLPGLSANAVSLCGQRRVTPLLLLQLGHLLLQQLDVEPFAVQLVFLRL